MNSKFLNKLVDAGFGLRFQSKSVVVTSATNDSSTGITKMPVVNIEMPKTLKVRYYPNQNKTTYVFPPKLPPRVRINNVNQIFDTVPEYQDYLYERYNEALDRITEQRQERIDERNSRHDDLEAATENVAKRMKEREQKKLDRLNSKSKGGKKDVKDEDNGEQQNTYEVK